MAFTIGSRADLETLIALGAAAKPRDIDLLSVESVRAAPEYLAAIQVKQAQGWACDRLRSLDNFARFSGRLTTLSDVILPDLQANPNDRQALRRLRMHGDAIHRLRGQADKAEQRLLVHLAGQFSNSLERSARQALRTNNDYHLPPDRVDHFLACVNACLDTEIKFPEVAPLPLPEDNGGDEAEGDEEDQQAEGNKGDEEDQQAEGNKGDEEDQQAEVNKGGGAKEAVEEGADAK